MIEKVVGKDHGRMDCKDTQKIAIIDRGSSGLGHPGEITTKHFKIQHRPQFVGIISHSS